MNWTDEQLDIFDWFEDGPGTPNAVVEARAGCGKTATTVEGVRRAPDERKIVVAFNRIIADELKVKVPDGTQARTLHSLGNGWCRKSAKGIKVDKWLDRKRVKEAWTRLREADTAFPEGSYDLMRKVEKITELVKGTQPFFSQRAEIDKVMRTFNLTPTQFEHEETGVGPEHLVEVAWHAFLITLEEFDGSISFADMIWIPLRKGWCQGVFDLICVDEAQDMSPAQIELAIRSLKPEGRICVIGDSKQCVPKGQPIRTPNGLRRIEDIHEGDLVYAAKAGEMVARKVVQKTAAAKSEAFEFDLGPYGVFQLTAEHVGFAAVDEPNGAYVYLMHREDLGFRIGVTQTAGVRGESLIVRTRQEAADRMWVLEWHPTFKDAAMREVHLSLAHQIPTTPFKSRDGMWADHPEAIEAIFAEFGRNGAKLLDQYQLDFERPNYLAKASNSKGRIAVNILIGTKDGHRVECETRHVTATMAGLLRMQPTKSGCYRTRRTFQSLREARSAAEALANKLGGYIAEHLANTGVSRRMMAVPAAGIHVGMLVPVVEDDGTISAAPVISRRKVRCHSCYDLEVDGLGTFVVGSTVVHNSIYQFRGADPRILNRLAHRLDAEMFSLTTTFRCPQAVVKSVNYLVSDLRAAPDAPEGSVTHSDWCALLDGAQSEDFVLSRTNAPLIRVALGLLARGKKAQIVGTDDFGKALKTTFDKIWERMVEQDLDAFHDALAAWESKEQAQATTDGQREWITDIYAGLSILAETAAEGDPAGVAFEIGVRIESIFGEGSPDAIELSTVHKAKGREQKTVWLIADSFPDRKSPPCSTCRKFEWVHNHEDYGSQTCGNYVPNNAWVEAEENIEYVAATRSQDRLIWIQGGTR